MTDCGNDVCWAGYVPRLECLDNLDTVRAWLRWVQHPLGGAMAFDFATRAAEYRSYPSLHRSLRGSEARGFNVARRRALRVIRSEGLDPDAELMLAMPPDNVALGARARRRCICSECRLKRG